MQSERTNQGNRSRVAESEVWAKMGGSDGTDLPSIEVQSVSLTADRRWCG